MGQRKGKAKSCIEGDSAPETHGEIDGFRAAARLLNPGVKALCHLKVDERPEGLRSNNMAAWDRDALLLFCIDHLPPEEGGNDEREIE